MLGFMNREALAKTQETGFVTFYSRSRKKLWTKGETSGQKLLLRELRVDCDRDALLVRAELEAARCATKATAAAFSGGSARDGEATWWRSALSRPRNFTEREENNEPPETRHSQGKLAGFDRRAFRESRLANFASARAAIIPASTIRKSNA